MSPTAAPRALTDREPRVALALFLLLPLLLAVGVRQVGTGAERAPVAPSSVSGHAR